MPKAIPCIPHKQRMDAHKIAIKNILDKCISGTYNIFYSFTRTAEALKIVYPLDFQSELKLGPTGKLRGTLDCTKL
jgi:hypothetical protein